MKVIYLIPSHGIGGVERAAQSLVESGVLPGIFHLATIREATKHPSLSSGFSGLSYFRCIGTILRNSPDFLVVSLWRAYFVGLLVKLIRPKVKLVIFLHLPKSAHWVDFLLTILASAVSFAVWADSQKTADKRFLAPFKDQRRVLSFVTAQIEANPIGLVEPKFIFWGRLHPQKNLQRALIFFRGFINSYSSDLAHFYIIGPDGGDQERIVNTIENLGLEKSVTLTGPMDFHSIRKLAQKACFYLQTSETEGMAMSVVEAMQLGLVPVVTPVGEIENYTVDGINSILFGDDIDVTNAIISLLRDESDYRKIRSSAIRTWENVERYPDSFAASCEELFNSTGASRRVD